MRSNRPFNLLFGNPRQRHGGAAAELRAAGADGSPAIAVRVPQCRSSEPGAANRKGSRRGVAVLALRSQPCLQPHRLLLDVGTSGIRRSLWRARHGNIGRIRRLRRRRQPSRQHSGARHSGIRLPGHAKRLGYLSISDPAAAECNSAHNTLQFCVSRFWVPGSCSEFEFRVRGSGCWVLRSRRPSSAFGDLGGWCGNRAL